MSIDHTDVITGEMSDRDRKRALATTVQGLIAQGSRVESQSEFNAVLVSGKKVNHALHGIVTVFTIGIWAPVWIIFAVVGGEKRTMATVDEFGNTAVASL